MTNGTSNVPPVTNGTLPSQGRSSSDMPDSGVGGDVGSVSDVSGSNSAAEDDNIPLHSTNTDNNYYDDRSVSQPLTSSTPGRSRN